MGYLTRPYIVYRSRDDDLGSQAAARLGPGRLTAPAASRARPGRRRGGRAWPLARLAAAVRCLLSPVRRTLGEALGCVLAEDLTARNDLPAADNSAMDGWAVAGGRPGGSWPTYPQGR